MIKDKNIIVSSASKIEELVVKLFPKHYSFFSLNTKQCKILVHKKLCLINHLNWLGPTHWPNENANEYLTHNVYTENIKTFVSRAVKERKSFLYADLVDYSIVPELDDQLIELTQLCKIPTIILYNAVQKIKPITQNKLDDWARHHFVLVDITSNINIVILLNYNQKKGPILYPGETARERQAISRKGVRWSQNFSQLPDEEKDYILMKLLSSYVKDK